MVFHGFWLVYMVFNVVSWFFSWFLVGFHGFSRWFHGFSWFLVGFPGFSRWFHGFSWFLVGFHGFSRWFHGFHGFWLVFIFCLGGFSVFHGFWLVFMVFLVGFSIFHNCCNHTNHNSGRILSLRLLLRRKTLEEVRRLVPLVPWEKYTGKINFIASHFTSVLWQATFSFAILAVQ